MDNQHRQIPGYRELGEQDIALIGEIKLHAVATEALLMKVQAHLGGQYHATEAKYAEPVDEAEEVIGTACIDTPEEMASKEAERQRINKAQPFRWHAVATTHLQEGYMALTRAVAQPTTF